MLDFAVLADHPDFAVTAVHCRDDHRAWSTEPPRYDVRVVLVRQGGFRRSVRGLDRDVDRMVGYVGLPGDEERFAHPTGGDACTSLTLTPDLWRTLAGDTPRIRTSAVYVDGPLELSHRKLLLAAREPDADCAGAEAVLDLLARIVRQVVTTATPSRLRDAAGDRDLVAGARALIGDDHPAAGGLIPLANFLEASPYRLSRAFTRELGVSLTRYRNRVRVGRALDRLEAGESSLAGLAADLGFADQAHLTRTLRDHLGSTPAALRRLLALGPTAS
ncbi:helix-turn-helix domain-containing protein [Kribbella sp. WER1]